MGPFISDRISVPVGETVPFPFKVSVLFAKR